jgi:hypothetical protein
MTPIVVLHDVGATGGPWRNAFEGWSDDVYAPDVEINGASGDRTDIVWSLLEPMEERRDRAPVVVGCGEHSLAAETFAFAGWCGGLVLVDGLGGVWTTPEQQIIEQNKWLRAKFDDPGHIGYPHVWIESFAASMRRHIRCPVLVIETPASLTAPDDADRRLQQFAGEARLVRLESPDTGQVAAAVTEWVGS